MKKIPCVFYLYLHSKLFERARGYPLPYKEAKSYLFQWKIPRKLRPLILKELEILGLVIKIKDMIEIERPKFKEEDCNGYYQELGIF